MKAEDKKKALEEAIAQIEKKCGKGSIMTMGGDTKVDVDVIPTGCIAVDIATGIGGLPRGRIIEIYGPESSGKTTLALQAIASAQKQGGIAAFIDAEHALDPIYAQNLGVDLENLYVSQPDDGEQALDIAQQLVQSNSISIIVIDSVAALVPRSEIDGDMGDNHVGAHARLMSQAMRKLTGIVNKTNTCVIFINQLREKVGVMFGNPETTTGGFALKFYSSMRIDVRKGESLKNGTDIIGCKSKIKIIKNKLAAPFKTCECDMIFGYGLNNNASILDIAVALGYISKMGAWFSYNDEKIAQGRDKAIEYLKNNKEVCDSLEQRIREEYGLKTTNDAE